MAVMDPRTATKILGGSVVVGAITYTVGKKVLEANNISGGLWDLALFLISVVPVGFAMYYVFA